MNAADPAAILATRYWEGLIEMEPIIGTMVGDERNDDRLGDPSPEPKMHKLLFDDLLNINAHFANHAGQIVWITKMLRGDAVDEVWIRAHKAFAWVRKDA